MRARLDSRLTAPAWVAVTVVLVIAGLWLAQRRILYLPDRGPGTAPGDVTVLDVRSSDGISHRVWLVPASGVPVARVLVFNGNAGNKAHRLPLARHLTARGMEVVLFDYRGYGDTEGSPSEAGLLLDAEAVAGIDFESQLPVVYLGESLGAGVATGLATRRPPDALVLRSPFTSLADMARAHFPFFPSFLLRDRYAVEEQIARIEAPLLVVLGTSDTIVPPALSRRVYEAAAGPGELVEMRGLNHNDPALSSGDRLAAEIEAFLERTAALG